MTIAVDLGRKATKQTNKSSAYTLVTYISNNMNRDQTAPLEQSDHGSYCLLP